MFQNFNKNNDPLTDLLMCMFCDKSIDRKNLYFHLKTYHYNRPEEELKLALTSGGIKINNKKKEWLKNKESIQKNIESRNLKIKINKKYKQVNKGIKKFIDLEYFGDKSKCDELLTKLNKISSKIDFGEVETSIVEQIKKRIEQLEKKPTKGEYIKKYCRVIYFTWDNILFQKNSIQINPFHGFTPKPIKVEGSLSILNQIKIDYFQRLYGKEIYRLVYKGKKVVPELSPDLFKIKEIIRDRYKKRETKINNTNNLSKSSLRGKSKTQIIKMINTGMIDNEYLKYPAKVLQLNDEVVALQEINNEKIEESLAFVFFRGAKVYVLWENINSNRAGYLFILNSKNYKTEISKIKGLIISNIKNKRQSLFRHISLKEFKINCDTYRCLIHESENEYIFKLRRLLE